MTLPSHFSGAYLRAASYAFGLFLLVSLACTARQAEIGGIPTAVMSIDSPPSGEKIVDIAGTHFTFRVSAHANLVYQLDCMAQMIPCSSEAFESLWREGLGWTPEDDNKLAAWRSSRARYGGRIEIRGEQQQARLPIPRSELNVSSRIQLAPTIAISNSEYRSLLRLLLRPNDVAVITDVEVHFMPRFLRWWQSAGYSILNRFLSEVEAPMQRPSARRVLEGAYRFYDAEKVDPVFTLIARPSHDSPLYGRQVGEYSFFEVGQSDVATKRLPAMMHELMHTLYAWDNHARLVKMANRFAENDDLMATAAYDLLNEALATALANGLLAEAIGESNPDRRLYHDQDIHLAASAALPLVRKMLEHGKSIHGDDFVSEYLSSLRAAFPNGLATVTYLRPLVLIRGREFGSLFDHISDATHASLRGGGMAANDAIADADSMELLGRFSSWPTLLALQPSEVHELSKLEEILGEALVLEAMALAQQRSAFILSGRRPKTRALVSILVAPDEETAKRLFDRWVDEPTLTLEGFYE